MKNKINMEGRMHESTMTRKRTYGVQGWNSRACFP
jgi:hypothetical protein